MTCSSLFPGVESNLGGISLYTPFGEDDWKRGLYAQIQLANRPSGMNC